MGYCFLIHELVYYVCVNIVVVNIYKVNFHVCHCTNKLKLGNLSCVETKVKEEVHL